MKIFDFDDYKGYVRQRIRQSPNKGQGEFQRISKALRVHPSLISQVFSGPKDLNPDQAWLLCKYFGLNPQESEYLLNLVQIARAVNSEHVTFLKKRRDLIREGKEIVRAESRPDEVTLSENDQAVFYSSWFYSGIRLISSISKYRTPDEIAAYFNLPKSLVRKIVEFLVEKGLCIEEKSGIRPGPLRTWIESDSPLGMRHHMNWRIKAIERMPRRSPSEFFATFPVCVGQEDSVIIRAILLDTYDEIDRIARSTKGEKVSCLNIDWFDV